MSLPKLPDVAKLAPGLVRVLGQNPSDFTLQGTNLYLLEKSPGHAVLLDTGSGRGEVPALVKQAMTLLDVQSIACFVLTHHHRDHTDGVSSLRDAISQSSSFAIYKVPDQHSDPTWLALQDGQAFSLQQGKRSLKVIQTPGHTADSICLQWREGPRLLGIFTADTVLGHGSSVYEDLSAY